MSGDSDDLVFAEESDDLEFAEESSGGQEIAEDKWKVLIVDDELEVHKMTQMVLQDFVFDGKSLEFLVAASGQEANNILENTQDIGLVLLDVVMEDDHAGLKVVDYTRKTLGNQLVRILLKTGQPGVAPEKETIDNYDIDNYLPKAELSSQRFYTAVRTALRAYKELVELNRHQKTLKLVHDSVLGLRSFEPLDNILYNILQTSVMITSCPLAVLELTTFNKDEDPSTTFLHMSTELDQETAERNARSVIGKVDLVKNNSEVTQTDEGVVIPFCIHKSLGSGWIYLDQIKPDTLEIQSLTLLAQHGANALYSAVTQELLKNQERSFYDSFSV